MRLKRTVDEPIHATVLSSMKDIDVKQAENELWEAAVSKWQLIFQFAGHPGPVGERLKMASLKDNAQSLERTIIREVFGIKAPRTASKRADSMRRFLMRCQSKGCAVWPVYASRVLAYLSGVEGATPASTTGLAVLECFRFCKHVMGIEIGEDVINDPQLRGRVNLLLVHKSNYSPARSLLCSEVAMLERFVCQNEDVGDTYLAGCRLLPLFARCRWSDLRYMDEIAED